MDRLEKFLGSGEGTVAKSVITDELLDSLRKVESGKDRFAINKETKAMGPYQFLPETVQMLHKQGIEFNPFNEKEARNAAKMYLGQLVERNQGDLNKALAQYGGFVTKDPSAYVQKVTQGAAQPAAQPTAEPSGDRIESFLSGKAAPSKPAQPAAPAAAQPAQEISQPRQIIGELQAQVQQPKETFGEFVGKKVLGAGEAGLSAVTGAAAAPVGAVAGILQTLFGGKYGTQEGVKEGEKRAQEVQQALTYTPRGEAGKEYLQAVGSALEASKLPPVLPEALALQSTVGPAVAQAKGMLPTKAAPGVTTMAVPPSATDVTLPPAVRQQIQAARTAAPSQMPPEQVAAMQAQFEAKKGAIPTPAKPGPEIPAVPPILTPQETEAKRLVGMGAAAVTPEKQRIERAKQLPVPIELSKDQATRDPADVRFARETAKDPVLGQALQAKYADDNLKIQQNLDHFIESTGAQYSGAAPGEVGQLLVNAIGPYQKARKDLIGPAYDAARAAGEMNVPVQVNKLAEFVEKNQSAAKNAPVISAVESEIKRLAKGGEITINDLEEVRKMVNVLAQDQGPNSFYGKKAIKVIDQMTEGKGGELYKKARRLNAAYMTEFEDTPVIRNLLAMKRGTTQRAVAIEDLVEKSMLKGPKSDVVQLFNTLNKAGPEGQQMINELRGYVAQRIKDEATKGVGRDINGLPYVSTHGLNKMIVDLDKSGKLELLFGKQGAEQYRTLNEVTKDLQTVPVGTTNPSGTASTLLAAMAEMGAQSMMTGVPLPVGMVAKHLYTKRQTEKNLTKINEFINYGKEK